MYILPPKSYTLDNLPSRKDFNEISGIYGFHCVPSNKWYVGQTENLYHRLSAYRTNLKSDNKENKHLRRAYNKYGKDAFKIHILTLCPKEDLNKFEKYYMDLYNTTNPYLGYNICYFDEKGNPQYRESFHERVKNPKTKIRFGDAKVIRELYAEGYTPKFIHNLYKIDNRHLSRILGNHNWRDPSYEKPKKVPSLNLAQRNIVDNLILRGKSAQEIVKLTNIYWQHITKYSKESKRSSRIKHTTLILDQGTGIYYTSVTEAAEAKNIKYNILRDWLIEFPHRNKTMLILVDACKNKRPTKQIILDQQTGIFYNSYSDAAKLHCVTPRTITRWLTDLPEYNKTSLILC